MVPRRICLGIALLLLVQGCTTSESPPTPWEIIRGSATLSGSAALTPNGDTTLASYPSRTGSITVAADSSVTGWIQLAAGDTAHLTGTVAMGGAGLVMTLTGITPGEYTVITRSDFHNIFGLLSTAIINSDVTGDAVPEEHRIYWQFSR